MMLDILIVFAALGAVVVLSFPIYLVTRMNANARTTARAREDIAALKAHVGVLLKTLGVDVQEVTREVAPGRTVSSYELKGDLEAQFGLAGANSRGLPQGARARAYMAGRTPLPQGAYPSPAYGESWPQGGASPAHEHAAVGLGYASAAPNSRGFGSHGPASQRRMSGGPGPNSRGLYPQEGR